MQDTSSEISSSTLQRIRGWLIDLDGVIYRGEQVLDGAAEFVELLRLQEIPFLFLTNNSTRTPEQYAGRLRSMGIAAEPREFYTSALATAKYLTRRAEPGSRILMIGTDGLRQALLDSGFELVHDFKEAEYCVVGYSSELTYDDLKRATLAIRSGAAFIATNPDPTLPVEEGLIPGIGATLAALTAASGVEPAVIGKPHDTIVNLALEQLGIPASATGILGDRLDTDILGGQRAGLQTVFILTGSNDEADLAVSDIHPNMIVNDLAELMTLWQSRFEI